MCALMALIRVRRRTGPLRLLTAVVNRLAREETWTTGCRQDGCRETRELAQALNAMADSVKGIVTELSEERDKLSTILATMTDGVALLDHEGHTTLANPAARESLGLPQGYGGGAAVHRGREGPRTERVGVEVPADRVRRRRWSFNWRVSVDSSTS